MKKYLFLLIPFMFLFACGTDSRKSEQTVAQPTAAPEPKITATANRAKSAVDQEIEKLTTDYEKAQILLDVTKVTDRITIDVEKSVEDSDEIEIDKIKIDRTKSDPSYFVRIINVATAPKLIIDRFYAEGEHLTKEIALKNAVPSENGEMIYDSASDSNTTIEGAEKETRFTSKAPAYRVIHKDGEWAVQYKESETVAVDRMDGESATHPLFEKIVALPEVKEATAEGDPSKIKKIRLFFSIRAKGGLKTETAE